MKRRIKKNKIKKLGHTVAPVFTIIVTLLTCTCWLTPRGSAGASQGVSVIVWPRHPRRQVPSPSLAS